MTHRIIPVDPFDLVIFGATGDLARRKLLPGMFHRDADGQLLEGTRIIGCARSQMDADGFRALARDAITDHVPADRLDTQVLERFLARLDYVTNNVSDADGWETLKDVLGASPQSSIRVFYLSVGPALFAPIVEGLAAHGLAENGRLVVEKPIGHDGASARALNDRIGAAFPEDRVYRIDHYLGKETVQNLIALRFANALFEPLWNARHVDHVQITVAESLGVEQRGPYYDRAGAMRDMVQNHLLQLLCLTAMEPPYHFEADAVRDEKLKVLRALRPLTGHDALAATVRGQYRGYAKEAENPDSHTESFVAIRAEIGSWRWAGTPFYLRTGKKLRSRLSEIVVRFRQTPHQIFSDLGAPLSANALIIRLQPDEGITLSITTKDPGPGGFRMRETPLDMSFAESAERGWRMPDAYERLVLDVVRGDQTLFMRRDEVEAAWGWVDPIIEAWETSGRKPEPYDSGSDGPYGAIDMLSREGQRWRELSP
ncbi:MAG: glucose-6-phosphate dehydrogenase [Rhodobiaceae bacterium]|nr:glucose-6-phosphate dehydrogenase [Rhodobiaceae bacterium]MCC0012309.1 glucose-6-phosphate dehydrogenase [Rhodobiaceae bacterium]MCC0060776.1 glucose-6-phosphate dehydrogenase [Rhodobiaceae bacterium]